MFSIFLSSIRSLLGVKVLLPCTTIFKYDLSQALFALGGRIACVSKIIDCLSNLKSQLFSNFNLVTVTFRKIFSNLDSIKF
ncbi:hypothetical protein APHACPA_0392 [Rickettsia amblyommatis str. Ac/Pa]|uniref:Uncharacterized protein n=1 Tax=Rickettsia amblyommatis str. Ac/Pa TaxID=1359164 RepID=A0A0F3N126_RICAM|nr:hypothetical protein APHACPA_0392 [Rickettsia amblyommatis str. Ac/Pa]